MNPVLWVLVGVVLAFALDLAVSYVARAEAREEGHIDA